MRLQGFRRFSPNETAFDLIHKVLFRVGHRFRPMSEDVSQPCEGNKRDGGPRPTWQRENEIPRYSLG